MQDFMYQIHHNSRSFHFSFSTRNQLFFSFRHDKMNRKFLTHALIGGIYEHFRTDPAIRTHYHRILRKPPAAVLRCHRRRSSLDRSCRETVDAGKRKYLKRLHSGGRETPSDIPDEQYLRHTNLLRSSCLRDHSDLSRVYILSKRCNDGS